MRTDTPCINSSATPSKLRPTIKVRGKYHLHYRYVFETAFGPIPHGLTVDHLCHNPRCIRLDHLRLETLSYNSGQTKYSLSDRCKNGHPYTPETTIVGVKGWRSCRICHNQAQRLRT